MAHQRKPRCYEQKQKENGPGRAGTGVLRCGVTENQDPGVSALLFHLPGPNPSSAACSRLALMVTTWDRLCPLYWPTGGGFSYLHKESHGPAAQGALAQPGAHASPG